MIVHAAAVSFLHCGCIACSYHLLSPPAHWPLPRHHRLQDKAQVLSDVRGIIAEQLGTDLDKVRAATPPPKGLLPPSAPSVAALLLPASTSLSCQQ